MSKKVLVICVAGALVAGGIAWYILRKPTLPPGFAGGNGRLEAKEIDVAAKIPGRIKAILFDEGDTVEAGQVVATLDTQPLDAQLRQAEAQIKEAQDNRNTALAQVSSKQAELSYAEKQYQRSKELVGRGAVSQQERDIDLSRADVARSSLAGMKSQAVRADSAIAAAQAESDRLKAEIDDYTLKAPVRARVETRVAEPGEVVGAGGKVLTLSDLSDVYMYVFLPTSVAGKVSLGSEARLVLDAMPQYPIKAVVSFVSPTAQFTPKTVETAEERHNLTFRVKLQLDKERLRQYEQLVKVGIPGMGYVRFDANTPWPAMLQQKPVSELPWKPTGSSEASK
jgi:HlyD family secretion protein